MCTTMIIVAIVIADIVNSIDLPFLNELVLYQIRLHMRRDDLLDVTADEGPESIRIGLHRLNQSIIRLVDFGEACFCTLVG